MKKKIIPTTVIEIPHPANVPEMEIPVDQEEPATPEEDPDIIPGEDPFENPTYKIPEPGEGP